jgi:hypothetical protein
VGANPRLKCGIYLSHEVVEFLYTIFNHFVAVFDSLFFRGFAPTVIEITPLSGLPGTLAFEFNP